MLDIAWNNNDAYQMSAQHSPEVTGYGFDPL
jgi:hypothetical protein